MGQPIHHGGEVVFNTGKLGVKHTSPDPSETGTGVTPSLHIEYHILLPPLLTSHLPLNPHLTTRPKTVIPPHPETTVLYSPLYAVNYHFSALYDVGDDMPFLAIFRSRYSLRALLVVMTLFALLLGYHINWIHQRRQAFTDRSAEPEPQLSHPVRAPGLLRMFGERGYQFIGVRGRPNQAEFERIKGIFPEAHILWINVPPIHALP